MTSEEAVKLPGTPSVRHRTPPAAPETNPMSGLSDDVGPPSGSHITPPSLSPERAPTYTLRPCPSDFVEKPKMVPPKRAECEVKATSTAKRTVNKNVLASSRNCEAGNPQSDAVAPSPGSSKQERRNGRPRRAACRRGWKGWAEEDYNPQNLILLDEPKVLPERTTRSGRHFS